MDQTKGLEFQKDYFGRLLKKAIGNRTITEFAQTVEVTRAYISQYVNSNLNTAPSPDLIKRISDKASNGVTYYDLMHAAGYIPKPDYNVIYADILNEIESETDHKNCKIQKTPGRIIYPILTHIDREEIIRKDNENLFRYSSEDEDEYSKRLFLRTQDDSMKGSGICIGNTLVIETQNYGENGDIIVAVTEENETLVRRFHKTNNIIILLPDNSEYEPLAYVNSEFKNSGIKIIGKVIEVRNDLLEIKF